MNLTDKQIKETVHLVHQLIDLKNDELTDDAYNLEERYSFVNAQKIIKLANVKTKSYKERTLFYSLKIGSLYNTYQHVKAGRFTHVKEENFNKIWLILNKELNEYCS